MACLLLWGWLFVSGTIVVVDRSGAIERAEVATGVGQQPLHRIPGGLFVGMPGADGTVRLVCRDGSARDYGYVTSADHKWLRVAKGGRCGRVEPIE